MLAVVPLSSRVAPRWNLCLTPGAVATAGTKEIRDPIHVFLDVAKPLLPVIASKPFQRLRSVHQLAMTYMVYPGASHKRFEHSLGVSHLAGQLFDVITESRQLSAEIEELIPDDRKYWRNTLQIAALCHDMGHLAFSHAAESRLLPKGWSHENLTIQIIKSDLMAEVFAKIDSPKPDVQEVLKLAIGVKEGAKKLPGVKFTPWEAILADIITGDTFGADRMDYLLRDSHHTGVAYGRFDHHRLVQTVRILPPADAPSDGDGEDSEPASAFTLGVEKGGLQSAEALQLARYFMFSQVYYHRTRRIFDLHLKDFMLEWLPAIYPPDAPAQGSDAGLYPLETETFLSITDDEVMSALRRAASDEAAPGHVHARRIVHREQFRGFYSPSASDLKITSGAGEAIYLAAVKKFGEENVRFAPNPSKSKPAVSFPVLEYGGRVSDSTALSEVFVKLLQPNEEHVYVAQERRDQAERWLESKREEILRLAAEMASQQEGDA